MLEERIGVRLSGRALVSQGGEELTAWHVSSPNTI